jgi:hypothetical protein
MKRRSPKQRRQERVAFYESEDWRRGASRGFRTFVCCFWEKPLLGSVSHDDNNPISRANVSKFMSALTTLFSLTT